MSTGATTSELRRCRELLIALVALAFFATNLHAQSGPSASPAERNVRISFLPPPLEGTISLGLYDQSGKLVRILHRESDVDEFEVGSDALITRWDGNDEAGKPLPAGKYHARGYAVGELPVEGIDFFFNDWVSDEHPERVAKICAIAADADGLVVAVQLNPPGSETFICDSKGDVVAARQEAAPISCDDSVATAPVSGKDHTQWMIEPAASESGSSEVKQYSGAKELLRRLTIPREDPQPRRIAASREADRIYLLEEDASGQRLRGLTLVAVNPGSEQSNSDWKVDFEKKITAHKNFGLKDGVPVATGGEQPGEKTAVQLQANPLRHDEKSSVDLAVGYDDEGSFLKTADGLPLQTISETRHLTRAVIVPHADKAVDVFQDDGSVVEQFRISNVDRMMAFDCGEIELK